MFSGAYESRTAGVIDFRDEPDAVAWEGANNYVGFWHSPALDLSDLVRIELEIKGEVASGACIDLRVEDVVPGQETGHVYRSDCLDLSGDVETHVLRPADFRKFEHFGEQEGELDWSRIKNVQLQMSAKPDDYYPYHGAYQDQGQGRITTLETDETIAWYGNLCYFGFSFAEPVDLSSLNQVRARLKGAGQVDLHLIDANKVSYYAADLPLSPKVRTHRLEKDAFRLFPYTEIGVLDWTQIRNIQFQVPSQAGARVAIDRVDIELGDGRTYTIEARGDTDSYASLRAINVILEDEAPSSSIGDRQRLSSQGGSGQGSTGQASTGLVLAR